ncbi:sigma-54 dependent transcriptional regulator [Guyparkeria hydrothermalis]|uniref:sigma-54 interaction domain-containing protein n=1 Tax=Guyparkeria hydrothermalis TaxID=923 RepID=UPI002021A480|nr:sigma-54 dependent transcriptional regulator [Guyparkeria hydrothermalis]MCL7743870.1 sigma-54 dependent transcriptional regulator [Guyparkeria hydrothermalis]
MSNEGRTTRLLPMLSLRGPDASEEIRQIAGSFLWDVVAVDSPEQLQQLLRRGDVRVALIDLRGAMQTAMSWLPAFAREHPCLQLVALVERAQAENVENAAFLHAYFFDICFAPVEPMRLTFSIGHAWTMAGVASMQYADEGCRLAVDETDELVGQSPAMAAVRRTIRRYAVTSLPVLINGPTGTGKELAARSIHRSSVRASQRFIAVNCGALTPNLVQSELFGHEKGAFTGASRRRIGWVEAANGGTLFLDEIGDLPLDTQTSLLRFLQQGEIQRVGGEATIPVDARIIAATHVDLADAVLNGDFREDLYFRLDVLPLAMPSLAHRGPDVLELAQYFLDRFCDELGVKRKRLAPATEAAMLSYDWPGNIRELMNRLRRGIVLADGPTVSLPDLEALRTGEDNAIVTLAEARERADRDAIVTAIAQAGHNVSEAARLLDVSRCTLHRLIRKHGLAIE